MGALPPDAVDRPIRVLVVDDSPIAVELVGRMLATAPDIRVVGVAANGVEALSLVPRLDPDVICTDLHMPAMDGLEFTRAVMARHPRPILLMSVSLQAGQEDNIFAALEAGALEIVAKPRLGLGTEFDAMSRQLIRKVRVLSGVKVFRRTAGAAATTPPAAAALHSHQPAIIGIGASTGGPQALEHLLAGLPPDFPVPLVCIQHIAPGFMAGLVDWLSKCVRLRVRMAQDGALPLPGVAHFAPDDTHLEIGPDGRFRLSHTAPLDGHRPSIDLAFGSLARRYAGRAAGVLLTGMGHDGARGLLDIARAHGFTIAQDEPTSIVFGMPRRAIELGAARLVLPLEGIAPALLRAAAPATTLQSDPLLPHP